MRGTNTVRIFIFTSNFEGIDYQSCNFYRVNDTITHKNDDKKFLMEADWTTKVDVGAVQFMYNLKFF